MFCAFSYTHTHKKSLHIKPMFVGLWYLDKKASVTILAFLLEFALLWVSLGMLLLKFSLFLYLARIKAK